MRGTAARFEGNDLVTDQAGGACLHTHKVDIERPVLLDELKKLASWHSLHGEEDSIGGSDHLMQSHHTFCPCCTPQCKHLRLQHFEGFLILLERSDVNLFQRDWLATDGPRRTHLCETVS